MGVTVVFRYTAIVLINAEDYHWLSHADYALFVEDYMTNAPQTEHMDPRWSRYHGIPESSCGNCDGLGEDRGGIGGFMDFVSRHFLPPAACSTMAAWTPFRPVAGDTVGRRLLLPLAVCGVVSGAAQQCSALRNAAPWD